MSDIEKQEVQASESKSEFSLKSVWRSVTQRLPSKNTLKKAFTPAALGIAAGVGAKIAAMAAGAAILGPVFTVAAGVGLTAYSFNKDYKKQTEHDNALDFFKSRWKGYSLRLALTTTSAFIGFGGADWIADNYFTVGAPEIIEVPTDDIPEIIPESGTEAPVEPPVEELPEEETEIIPEEPALVIPESPYEKLALLAQNPDLSDQAREMIDAALKGQTWAVRDVGLGLINGFYGFDQLGELTDLVDADAWGAQLLKDAVETGDVKARIDYAYFQYTGVNDAIAQDQAAALKTVAELDRVWLHGDSVLDKVHLDQARELFVANMPEGTDINDYRVEKLGDEGYKFINLAQEQAIKEAQEAAMREAGFDPSACQVEANSAQDGFIIKTCRPQFGI